LTEKHASFIHSKNSICVYKTYEYQLMLFNNDEKKIKGKYYIELESIIVECYYHFFLFLYNDDNNNI